MIASSPAATDRSLARLRLWSVGAVMVRAPVPCGFGSLIRLRFIRLDLTILSELIIRCIRLIREWGYLLGWSVF